MIKVCHEYVIVYVEGVVYHLLQLIHCYTPIALCGFVYAIVLQYAFHLHKGTTAQE